MNTFLASVAGTLRGGVNGDFPLLTFVIHYSREREALQDILRAKRNRTWSVLDALKDVVASFSSMLRRDAKPGVNLEKLIAQMEDHEVRIRYGCPCYSGTMCESRY